MKRPDWNTQTRPRRKIDLSTNVHYDYILNREITKVMSQQESFHDYPHQLDLYTSIAEYYKINVSNMAIGYGATEILERVFKTLDFDTTYVVEPNFEMVSVYCDIYNKTYVPITFEEAKVIDPSPNSILVIANPNGNNGELHDIRALVSRYKYLVSDEVYADFNTSFSLIHNQHENVIVVKSFSKSLGLAGFRCGFAVSSESIIRKLQEARSNFIMSSFSSLIIPSIIHLTKDVVGRMNDTKSYLETRYECKHSDGNYVLFNKPNKYTERFGSKFVDGYYRMALTNLETLNNESY